MRSIGEEGKTISVGSTERDLHQGGRTEITEMTGQGEEVCLGPDLRGGNIQEEMMIEITSLGAIEIKIVIIETEIRIGRSLIKALKILQIRSIPVKSL